MRQAVTIGMVLCLLSMPCAAQFFPPVKEKTIVTGIGFFQEINYANSYLFTLDIAKEYKIRTWFAFGAEGNVFKFTSTDYSSAGISIRPVTRLLFYSGEKLTIFGETKGGIIFMLPQYPHRLINFTFTGTVGADWYFKDGMAIRFGGGYTHFSNGKPYADLKNPTWDGIGASVSLVRRLQ